MPAQLSLRACSLQTVARGTDPQRLQVRLKAKSIKPTQTNHLKLNSAYIQCMNCTSTLFGTCGPWNIYIELSGLHVDVSDSNFTSLEDDEICIKDTTHHAHADVEKHYYQ